MDELGKALAEAIKSGTAAVGPAMHQYFTFRIWDDVLGYGAWIAAVGIICFTIMWCMNRGCRSDEMKARHQ